MEGYIGTAEQGLDEGNLDWIVAGENGNQKVPFELWSHQ